MPLIKNGSPAPVPEVKVDTNPPALPVVKRSPPPVADDKMSKADWAAKDRRAARGFAFNAAVQSPALMQYAPTLEAYLKLVIATADASIAYQDIDA